MEEFEVKVTTKQKVNLVIDNVEDERVFENVTAVATYIVKAPNLDAAEIKFGRSPEAFDVDIPEEHPELSTETGIKNADFYVRDVLEQSKPIKMTFRKAPEKTEQLYIVQCGYHDESGDNYSPIFITKDPSVADKLNRMKETWAEIAKDQHKEIFKLEISDYKKLVAKNQQSAFGKYADFIKGLSNDDEFIATPMQVV